MADQQVVLTLSVQQADLARAALRRLGRRRLRDAQRATDPNMHRRYRDVGDTAMSLVAEISRVLRETVGDDCFQALEQPSLAGASKEPGR